MNFQSQYFTYALFQNLKELAAQKGNQDEFEWFKLSYKAFINHPVKDSSDLIRLIAFAYSWMPTMAKFKSKLPEDIDSLIKTFNSFSELKDLSELDRKEKELQNIVYRLVSLINNSVVGTSKVLHFYNPAIFPIIDSRVITGWNLLFKNNVNKTDLIIPKYVLLHKEIGIPIYLNYMKIILCWLTTIRKEEAEVQIRDIEVLLYQLGGKQTFES
ncbi:MAG TPA: hypothetical protein VL442_06825 [Mucilaginibacter sp.]|jgi:hypothetical protein|nr:hypothetical protein [Mucilaginibacter sp.]